MRVDELVSEYRRRSVSSIVALLRASGGAALGELRDLLAQAPELRGLTLAELFAGPPGAPPRPAPAPPSAAAKIAAYLLDAATTAGRREAAGILVKLPGPAQLGELVGARRESVSLTLAILRRRNLITVHPRGVLVRDLRGLALIADRPPPEKRAG